METTSAFSLDAATLRLIEDKFNFKKELAKAKERELFGVFDGPLTEEETVALKFLFAYMPLNDLADYDGELFLSHVRTTLDIRKQVPWGMQVPDHLLLHFVLPYRVNNENIEDSRGFLFGELFDRTKELPMADAILETNHWCHEKATYIGNDPRTVSPLTLIRTTLGRCGEQSTLAVAALRSLCIPARQCYTPRWAHCDSNHAWVEAWADGKWHFLGACEPEPRLNQGWFRAPARRAMLVNTRVQANYPGPEEVTLAREWFTEINLLDNYAPNKTITVQVRDENDAPADADVHFQLYNFAELSTMVSKTTDDNGNVQLTTGFGDLIVHASGSKGWDYAKIRVSDGDVFTVVVADRAPVHGIEEFEMVPPPELAEAASDIATDEEKRRNDERVKEGAQIRANFEATFVSEEAAKALASELSLPEERVWTVLKHARGNSHEIAAFLREQSGVYGEWALKLLESLNQKDMTDTFRPTLADHLTGSLPKQDAYDDETFAKYVLCPRVHYEMVAPYKAFFQHAFTDAEKAAYRKSPAALAERIGRDFEVVDGMNHYRGSATPVGSFKLLKGDRLCRDIVFVAAARSVGIAARLEPTDQRPQYLGADGAWKDAAFGDSAAGLADKGSDSAAAANSCGTAPNADATCESAAPSAAAPGAVRLLPDGDGDASSAAAYFNTFTLARFEDGMYRTLSYAFGKTDVFDEPFELLAGEYRLTTGTRLSDGTVLVRLTHFAVASGETLELPLVFRRETITVPVLDNANADCALTPLQGAAVTLPELASKQGLVLAWIEPDREPSKHLIREIGELAAEFDAWGGPVWLVAGDDKITAAFAPEAYTGLPDSVAFGRDNAYASLQSLTANLPELSQISFPAVFVIDGECRIRYQYTGYKLGTGKEILKTIQHM